MDRARGDRHDVAGRLAVRHGGPANPEPRRNRDVSSPAVEAVLRDAAPHVLVTLVRRHGRFDACEDSVQEALLAAAVQWPERGIPDNPNGWLITVASRRLADQLRSDESRHRREGAVALSEAQG